MTMESVGAPYSVEFAQLCARYEELEKHNSTLKGASLEGKPGQRRP